MRLVIVPGNLLYAIGHFEKTQSQPILGENCCFLHAGSNKQDECGNHDVGEAQLKKFRKIYIEITNVCNLACNFCPRTNRKAEFMSFDTFAKILEQIKAHTDSIYFHVKGEPLLHPEISRFLDLCHEKGFQVNITTNGTLIQQVQEMLLTKPALRQINFSLHSADQNDGMQSKAEYMNRILAFTKEAMKKTEIFISLRLWNLEENSELDFQGKVNHELLELIETEFSLPEQIQEAVVLKKGIKIAERVYLNQDYQFRWPDINLTEDNRKGFCFGLRNQAAILVDGTVLPCCLDGEGVINLGNINVKPFSEIIESKRANDLFDGFTKREAVEELCRKCGYRKRFDK